MSKHTLLDLIDTKWKIAFSDTVTAARRMVEESIPAAELPKMVWNFDTPELAEKSLSR